MWEAASRCLIFRSSLDRSKPSGKYDPATSRRFFAASIKANQAHQKAEGNLG